MSDWSVQRTVSTSAAGECSSQFTDASTEAPQRDGIENVVNGRLVGGKLRQSVIHIADLCKKASRGVATRQLERGSKPGADAGQLECENTPSVDTGLFKRGKTRLVVSTQASSSVIIYLYQGIGSRPTVQRHTTHTTG